MHILRRLNPEEAPHPVGSIANDRVRDAILSEVRALGLEPRVQRAFVCSDYRRYCGTVHNVLARLPSTIDADESGRAVVIHAHYDSQAATPGAADALVGVASVLEIARILQAERERARDVIVFLSDGEEAGLLGSTAFVNEHPWAGSVVAFVNLEARGSGGISIPAYTIGEDGIALRPYLRVSGDAPPGRASPSCRACSRPRTISWCSIDSESPG